MTVRTVTKSLAGMEDLAAGVGKIQQVRAGLTVEVGQIDQAYAVLNEAELADVDVANFTYGRIGDVEYRYDSNAVSGDVKSNVGPGWWLIAGAALLANTGDSSLVCTNIWPQVGNKSAAVGDLNLSDIGALRDATAPAVHYTEMPVSGEITALDFINKTATIGGETTRLFKQKNAIYAHDHIVDYKNPTDAELDFLMTADRLVIWQNDKGQDIEILTGKTINLQGNTIWKAEVDFTVTLKATHNGYHFHPQNNTGTCGTIGINYDGGLIADNIVQFTNCNNVICLNSIGKDITGEATANYRGGFIFLNCTNVVHGNLHARNIRQLVLLPPFLNPQFQSFSFNNCGVVSQVGACTSVTADKLFHTDGVTTGDCGTFVGEDIQDNAAYFLGTPNAMIVRLVCDGLSEGIVYNVASNDSSVYVPYAKFKNGRSRVVGLRSGGGLRVGKLIASTFRTGIFDTSFSGSVGCQFEDVYIENIEEERALELQFSSVIINRLSLIGVNSLLFNEVCRLSNSANVDIGLLRIFGGAATTAVRFNNFNSNGCRIRSLQTDKVPTVYEASQDFGGKVTIDKINNFTIEGNEPAPLTISGGVITITGSYHRVDTEGGAATDDIDTIDGAPSIGTIVTLQSQSNVRDPILKHNTGNIWLPNATDIRLNVTYDRIRLRWDGTYWSPSL